MTRVEELIEGVLQFPADGRDAEETLGMYADILGGPTVLPELLRAYERNRADGHDNDSFAIYLIDLV